MGYIIFLHLKSGKTNTDELGHAAGKWQSDNVETF